jgi:hypothetical protein
MPKPAAKEIKPAAELEALISNELRAHQLNDIVNIKVLPSTGPANWTATYEIESSHPGPWPIYPEADEIIRLFQRDFDLVETAT